MGIIVKKLLDNIKRGKFEDNWGYGMGLPKLEYYTGGVAKQTYTLIFSDSGSGKTSLSLYAYIYRPIIEHLDDENFKVIYYSLELEGSLLLAKLLSIYIFEKYGIEVSMQELLSRRKGYKLSDELYKIVQDCEEWLNKVEKIITIYDKRLNCNFLYTSLLKEMEAIGNFVERDKRKIYYPDNPNLTTLVVIDHLSLVTPTEGRTLKQEMDTISSYLVTLRNMCGISPLVIMQANRNNLSDYRMKTDPGFNIGDMKDSGSPIGWSRRTLNSAKQGKSYWDNLVLILLVIREKAKRLEVMPANGYKILQENGALLTRVSQRYSLNYIVIYRSMR